MVKYVNRRGQIYFLHQGKTKTGKPRYTLSQKEDGTLVEAMPDGYEIYENPNARVYLRKISPKIITDEEISIVEDGIINLSNLEHFKIDVKKNQVIIHTPDQDLDTFKEIISDYAVHDDAKIQQSFNNILTYSAKLRFALVDEESRGFRVERKSLWGSIDDWIELNCGSLKSLVKKYCPHLGKDSFYELM